VICFVKAQVHRITVLGATLLGVIEVWKPNSGGSKEVRGDEFEHCTVCGSGNKKTPCTKTAMSSKRHNIFAQNFQRLLERRFAMKETSITKVCVNGATFGFQRVIFK